MTQMKIFRSPRMVRGFTLIESLIAIVVMALGILGILGVQMRTLADTSTTVRRAQAIRLIEDLGERMHVNPNAVANLGAYVSGFSATPPSSNCSTGCDNAQLAAYDLYAWKDAVSKALPLGQASIFIPPAETGASAGQGRQLGVMIAWRENERDTSATYKDDIDATKVRANDGTLTAGAGTAAVCPANRVCQLQYIPIADRCIPYSPGGSPTTYFCPGA